MASKRVAKTAIDWTRFQKLVPQNQTVHLNNMISKNFQYSSRVVSLPESLPKIDFEAYRSLLSNKASIEKLEKGYKSYQVPYPKDVENQIGTIDAQEKAEAERINAHLVEVKKQLAEINKARETITSIPPLEEMTKELEVYYFPNTKKTPEQMVGDDPFTIMLENQKKGAKHH